jgi:SAM-dependent methyltransferase
VFASNVETIMSMIEPEDLVIDLGGWWMPFARADWVVDVMPYATRGRGGKVVIGPERFSETTWIQQDLCDRKGLPFADKMFDFCVCSHVLEDVRDPVFLCSEIQRISKRGYIETPSRRVEQCLGVESGRYCGYHHHRWMVEMDEGRLTFLHKSDLPLLNWRLRLPSGYSKRLAQENAVAWMYWDGAFEYGEKILLTHEEEVDELESFVRKESAYSNWRYAAYEIGRRFRHALRRRSPSAEGEGFR